MFEHGSGARVVSNRHAPNRGAGSACAEGGPPDLRRGRRSARSGARSRGAGQPPGHGPKPPQDPGRRYNQNPPQGGGDTLWGLGVSNSVVDQDRLEQAMGQTFQAVRASTADDGLQLPVVVGETRRATGARHLPQHQLVAARREQEGVLPVRELRQPRLRRVPPEVGERPPGVQLPQHLPHVHARAHRGERSAAGLRNRSRVQAGVRLRLPLLPEPRHHLSLRVVDGGVVVRTGLRAGLAAAGRRLQHGRGGRVQPDRRRRVAHSPRTSSRPRRTTRTTSASR